MGEILYLKVERNVEIPRGEVFLGDVAKITCRHVPTLEKAKSLRIYNFSKGETRQVIGVIKMIELLERHIQYISVESIGETDVVIELVKVPINKPAAVWIKVAFVSMIAFFGTAFTMMAFHNDVGIHDVFARLYTMVMGRPATGYGILEVMYSIGVAAGITVFFNHIGGRRLSKDPTPIEVAMRTYENDVNTALVETADREGTAFDVD